MFVIPAVHRSLISISGVLLLSLAGITVTVQANTELPSANERINFSGKLRMLSQRAAASACNLSAGVDTDKNRQILTLTRAEFAKILHALENSDSDLNINGKETDAAILAALQTINENWQSFDAAITRLANDNASTDDTDIITSQNLPLLESAQQLVKVIRATYTNTATASADFGHAIDVAGRQRMLTQKMSKEACQIWSGQNVDTQTPALKATMELFESSMLGLREGNENLIAPPTDQIEQDLSNIWDEWTAVKPELNKALTADSIDLEARKKLSRELNLMLRNMNTVVGLYTVAQKEQGNIDDEGATERVNFSGKLRMLSQRVAAASCNLTAGIMPEQSQAMLTSAQAEFSKILQALEFGDADLRIRGQEKRRKTLEALAGVHQQWDPMNNAISSLVNNESVNENLALINQLNMPLLSAAKLLVSEISGEYTDPSVMMQSDALLIDIAGRQRMLTQKMSKESCSLWSGQSEMADELKSTMKVFDTSLLALRKGLEGAGVRAAPTAEIMYGLDDIWVKWKDLEPTLQAASDGNSVDPELRADVSRKLDVLLADMNVVVGMYTIFGKTGL